MASERDALRRETILKIFGKLLGWSQQDFARRARVISGLCRAAVWPGRSMSAARAATRREFCARGAYPAPREHFRSHCSGVRQGNLFWPDCSKARRTLDDSRSFRAFAGLSTLRCY